MNTKHASDLTLLRRLYSDARHYRLHFVAIFVLSLAAAPLSLLVPLPVKITIDCVVGDHALPWFVAIVIPQSVAASKDALLTLSAGLLIGIAIVQYVRGLAESVLATYTTEYLVMKFRARLLEHVQRLSLAFHDARGTSDSLYRIQYDATTFEGVLIKGIIPIVTAGFMLLAMIYISARIDWSLTLIALAASPILLVITQFFRKRLRRQWSRTKELESTTMGVVQEVLASLRVILAFGQEQREEERFVRHARQAIGARLWAVTGEGVFSTLIGATVAGGSAAVLYIGVRHVQTGSLTLGDLVLVMLYLAMLYQPLETIGVKFAGVQSALASADRAFSLLDQVPDVHDLPEAKSLGHTHGNIEYQRVSFAYDAEHPVLNDVSFQVAPGTRVGIAGTTGAGKSTLVSLLPRFYDPTGGQILLDGRDIRDFKLAELRRQFAIVLQDTMLFSTTIAENIAYGRPNASQSEIIDSAKAANAHDFITHLPEGYATEVGERGMRLSGGERQRIALARAFLRNAPFLILDEPTSAVDVKTEGLVMEALERLMETRTTFLISHRPNTLDNCHLLLHLEHGRLSNKRGQEPFW